MSGFKFCRDLLNTLKVESKTWVGLCSPFCEQAFGYLHGVSLQQTTFLYSRFFSSDCERNQLSSPSPPPQESPGRTLGTKRLKSSRHFWPKGYCWTCYFNCTSAIFASTHFYKNNNASATLIHISCLHWGSSVCGVWAKFLWERKKPEEILAMKNTSTEGFEVQKANLETQFESIVPRHTAISL